MNLNGRGVIVIMIWTMVILLLYHLYLSYQNSMSKSSLESRMSVFIPKLEQ